jgi:UPF0176 protein
MDYPISLYYQYSFIKDSETEVVEHLPFCQSLGLRGRVYINPKVINDTVS